MTGLLIATTNPGKIREIQGILNWIPITLLTLDQFPDVPEPDEPGETFAELVQPGDRAQRSSDQPLNLLRAAADFPGAGLALGPGIGRARQHPVLGGHPALAGVAEERRHAVFDAGCADDFGAAHLDKH